MDFPRLVYKSASVHQLVEDVAQFDAAIEAGWFATVPEALSGVSKPAAKAAAGEGGGSADDAPPTRAELEQKAAELGITFNPTLGDKKLQQRIEAKLAENAKAAGKGGGA